MLFCHRDIIFVGFTYVFHIPYNHASNNIDNVTITAVLDKYLPGHQDCNICIYNIAVQIIGMKMAVPEQWIKKINIYIYSNCIPAG